MPTHQAKHENTHTQHTTHNSYPNKKANLFCYLGDKKNKEINNKQNTKQNKQKQKANAKTITLKVKTIKTKSKNKNKNKQKQSKSKIKKQTKTKTKTCYLHLFMSNQYSMCISQ